MSLAYFQAAHPELVKGWAAKPTRFEQFASGFDKLNMSGFLPGISGTQP